MDPVTAFGLAVNIFTAVHLSQKLISKSYELYSSASGATSENADLAKITLDLEALTPRLSVPRRSIPATQDEANLRELARNCQSASNELLKLLEKLRAKKPNSKMESVRVAARNLRKKSQVESLAKKLDQYRTQIMTRLQVAYTSSAREGQLSATKEIQDALKNHGQSSHQTLEAVKKTQADLAKTSQELLQQGTAQSKTTGQITESQSRATEDIRIMAESQSRENEVVLGMLNQLLQNTTKLAYEEQVLEKLEFREMHHREDMIEEEHAATFRWLLYDPSEDIASPSTRSTLTGSNPDISSDQNDDGSGNESSTGLEEGGYTSDSSEPQADRASSSSSDVPGFEREMRRKETVARSETRQSFLAWLNSGSGIFYISGKVGAGKSTLMKYLCRESATLGELGKWTGGKKLIFAPFFFWAAGSEEQKSLCGLYRSILWTVLSACPDLATEVFPGHSLGSGRRMGSSPFEPSVIREGFANLVKSKRVLAKHKLCFFIDGLDEFDGDYMQLARLLRTWSAKAEDVKICVACRPKNEFEGMFSDPCQRLRLHELTRADMQKFIEDKFWLDEKFTNVHYQDARYGELIESIVERADGVFLWVRLVTQELLHGIRNEHSISHLQKRLESLPDGLHALFQSMFQSIDKLEREAAARDLLLMKNLSWYYKIALAWSVIDDFHDDYDMESLYTDDLGPTMTDDELESRVRTIHKRVNDRCKGLLQLTDAEDIKFALLEFVHRSVHEYLADEAIQGDLLAAAKGFDAEKSICQAYIRLLKGTANEIAFSSGSADITKRINNWVQRILWVCSDAETATSNRLMRELDATYRIVQKAATMAKPPGEVESDGWYPMTGTHKVEYGIRSTRGFVAAPGRLFVSLAVYDGLAQFCVREGPAFGRAYLDELLFRWSVGPYSQLSPPNALLEAGASPNGAIPSALLSSEDAAHNSVLKFSQWTVWTLFLYKAFMDYPELPLRYSYGSSHMMEFYIKHDADPTVLFLACLHQPDGVQKLACFDLGQFLELENLATIKQLLNAKMHPSTWSIKTWLTSALGRPRGPQPVELIDTESLRASEFHVLRVCGRNEVFNTDGAGISACNTSELPHTRFLRMDYYEQ